MRILDGSPGAGGLKERGQSLVELALITPLLIIMFIGIVEIGWYANHLLILMEVTRVGARSGALASGQLSPLNWVETPEETNPTIHPIAYLLDNGYANVGATSPSHQYRVDNSQSLTVGSPPAGPVGWDWLGTGAGIDALQNTIPGGYPSKAKTARDCDNLITSDIGFYNLVVCAMVNSMDPLELSGRVPYTTDVIPKNIPNLRSSGYMRVPYPDDIVVSVFALQLINNAAPRSYGDNPGTTTLIDNPPVMTLVPNAALGIPSGTRYTEKNDEIYKITYDFLTNNNTYDDSIDPGFKVHVVGRYPTTANECNVRWQPAVAPSDADNQDTVVQGPAASPNNITLDVRQPIIDRILGPLAYDYVTGTNRLVYKASAPIPAGTFIAYDYPNVFDPFDFIPNNVRDADSTNERFIELAGWDQGPEIQRGFVYTGQHVVNDVDSNGNQTFCLGSEWTDDRVENLMNAPAFLQKNFPPPPQNGTGPTKWYVTNTPDATEVPMTLVPADNNIGFNSWYTRVEAGQSKTNGENYVTWQQQASQLPGQGLVLVEIFWSHSTLMDFPFMRPIVTMFGDPQRITISVWAAFPVPAIQPNIIFQLPND